MICFDELTFLKEMMLIMQVNQNDALFITISTFLIKGLSFKQMSAMVAMIY